MTCAFFVQKKRREKVDGEYGGITLLIIIHNLICKMERCTLATLIKYLKAF